MTRKAQRRVGFGALISLMLVSAASAQEHGNPPSAAAAAPRAAAPSPPVDAELESSLTGRPFRLSSLRPRVVVLFSEDREHIPQNEALKGTLERFIADNHLESQMTMQPVANADGYNYAPVSSIVRTGLSEASRRIGLDILIDWDRRLYSAPFRFQAGASNVTVLDRQGRIVWRHAGAVGAAEQTALFRTLRQSLRSPS